MSDLARKRILVVDDDVHVLLALRKRLNKANFDVLTASKGSDALELARGTTIDAITLDVAMPGDLDGLDVASALRLDPRTAHIPIIFVTGTADADFKESCEAAGGKWFLAKPYDADLLVHLLNSVFATDELAEIERVSQCKRRQPVK